MFITGEIVSVPLFRVFNHFSNLLNNLRVSNCLVNVCYLILRKKCYFDKVDTAEISKLNYSVNIYIIFSSRLVQNVLQEASFDNAKKEN